MSLDPSMTANGTSGNPAASSSGSTGAPSGASPSGAAGGGGGMSSGMTDTYNFLRGGWPTNSNGIVTFNTVYPGFCKCFEWSIKVLLTDWCHRYWTHDPHPYNGSYQHYVQFEWHIYLALGFTRARRANVL